MKFVRLTRETATRSKQIYRRLHLTAGSYHHKEGGNGRTCVGDVTKCERALWGDVYKLLCSKRTEGTCLGFGQDGGGGLSGLKALFTRNEKPSHLVTMLERGQIRKNKNLARIKIVMLRRIYARAKTTNFRPDGSHKWTETAQLRSDGTISGFRELIPRPRAQPRYEGPKGIPCLHATYVI